MKRGLESAIELARAQRLYPAVILHGGAEEARRQAAVELARVLLCAEPAAARPCGRCRNCRRIAWPGGRDEPFHPDFRVLERDTKISTSVDAARTVVLAAQSAPFEARGQVFVVASAETLSGEAANALLKLLEEPPARSPRHFLLLAPSRLDLLPTLRSRALSVYLGAGEAHDEQVVETARRGLVAALEGYAASGSGSYLLAAAAALTAGADFGDLRATRPWSHAAAAARAAAVAANPADEAPARFRRPLLELADALLQAPDWRLRGIPAERIAEGLVAKLLTARPA